MASSCFFRIPSYSPSFYSHRPAVGTPASPVLWRRRAPLVGAFWVLSLGALSALACKTGCSYSHRFLPSFRSKFTKQSPGRSIHSAAMDSASSTVPSIVVYVTVPNREAGNRGKSGESGIRFLLIRTDSGESGRFAPIRQTVVWTCFGHTQYCKDLCVICHMTMKIGIESVYWWDGKVQTDSEELLIIKTRESLLDALTEHVKANHEYEVPEVISLPITGGNLKYLEWIKNSTRD
ncbi:hypothetical protein Taro_033382 [Colocasia esculenta]|uniref:Protein CutA, chloroplastic n=1 Tax=Colocasia esculenta TaxID=4460 RepID=A0A843VXR1_COLES|nr:hypothetical protein [Colocasia esculenta]